MTPLDMDPLDIREALKYRRDHLIQSAKEDYRRKIAALDELESLLESASPRPKRKYRRRRRNAQKSAAQPRQGH